MKQRSADILERYLNNMDGWVGWSPILRKRSTRPGPRNPDDDQRKPSHETRVNAGVARGVKKRKTSNIPAKSGKDDFFSS